MVCSNFSQGYLEIISVSDYQKKDLQATLDFVLFYESSTWTLDTIVSIQYKIRWHKYPHAKSSTKHILDRSSNQTSIVRKTSNNIFHNQTETTSYPWSFLEVEKELMSSTLLWNPRHGRRSHKIYKMSKRHDGH